MYHESYFNLNVFGSIHVHILYQQINYNKLYPIIYDPTTFTFNFLSKINSIQFKISAFTLLLKRERACRCK